MTFRTYFNSRSMRTVSNIIKAEDLHVSVRTFVDALGDDIIEVKGQREEIKVLKQIFTMVY